MAEDLSLVIINPDEGKFLDKIDWNKDEFMELVASITEQYTDVVYTDENMKLAKEDLAKLRKMKSAISDRRIAFKKVFMEPFDNFEKEVKEVVALIEKPISMIDGQVKAYEEKVKTEKKRKLEEYFDSIVGNLDGTLSFGQVFDQRYMNANVTIKKASEDIRSKVEKVRTDFSTIETMCEEKYHSALKVNYMQHLDISRTLNECARYREIDRRKEEERLRKAEEERQREEAQKAIQSIAEDAERLGTADSCSVVEAANEVVKQFSVTPEEKTTEPDEAVIASPESNTDAVDPFTPKDEVKMFKASFTVYGTREQIMTLKQYMIDNNIKFGKVE